MTGTGLCGCKIGRAEERYSFDDLNEDLIDRHQDGASLRDLAKYVNRRILRAAIEQAKGDLLEDGRQLFGAFDDDEVVVAIYTALTDEDIPAERGARVRTRLEQAAVDIDRVEADWVTHPTVRSHLRECLDIDTGSTPALSTQEGLDTIEWSVARCTGVIEQTLRRLRSADRLVVENPETDVSVRVTCVECGSTYSPNELLSTGRCDCVDEK